MTIATTVLAVPASAVALTTGAVPQAAAEPQAPLKIDVDPQRLAYGQDVTVTGAVTPADRGATLWLQIALARDAGWRSLTSTRVGPQGRFSVRAPLRSSGRLRVVGARSGAGAPTDLIAPVAAAISDSAAQAVSVAPQLRLHPRAFDVLGGRRIDLRGRLLPSAAGRWVRLQGRTGHAWTTLTSTRTSGRGGFDLHYRPVAVGQRSLRVLFSGDLQNSGVSRPAGQLDVYDQTVASWYDDGGSTACGFHATFGVASRDQPCGTRVRFRHGARGVTAVVDDRGPYVGGRDWDLNQNTASALGFAGVGTVWSTG